MRKILVSAVLALVLVTSAAVPAFAADYADVTVTATPAIIAITNAPTDWTMNDSGATAPGDDAIRHASTYYSNDADNTAQPSATVDDGECRFLLTNTGTLNLDIAIAFSDFTLGDTMPNSDTGSATATDFGAKAYVSGDSFPGSELTVAGTAQVIANLPHTASNTKKWGVVVYTRTDAFTSTTSMEATITLTATEAA